jgi:uncharacterized lipoprotein YddW (UPF0748 family)
MNRPFMSNRNWLGTVLIGALMCIASQATGAPATRLEQCIQGTDAEVRAAWEPMRGSPQAELTTIDGNKALRLRCDFSGPVSDRGSWDQRVALDLSGIGGIEFKILCRNFDPIQYFAIYFQGENGWYTGTFFPEYNDRWDTIRFSKADFQTEGDPGGWDKIRTVRISAWKSGSVNTEFYVKDLRATGLLGEDAFVLVLRGAAGAKSRPDQAKSIEQTAERVAAHLQEAHLPCVLLNDLDITQAELNKARLIVLPNNPDLTKQTVDALLAYVRHGGKVLGFYTVPDALGAALNIGSLQAMKAPADGAFSKVQIRPGALPGAPAELTQTSPWIVGAKPIAGKSRVLADWLDAEGKPGGYPAIIGSTNCIWMTHVLQPGDRAARQQLLLAMAGSLVPELWNEPVNQRIAAVGAFGRYEDFRHLTNALAPLARKHPAARESLAEAVRLRDAATRSASRARHAEALDQADKAAKAMERAYAAAQESQPGEFRAFWCHSAFGVKGMTWDEAIGTLAANGFTAVLPNMMWGGAAFYPSKLLPMGKGMEGRSDQVKECLEACKKHGIQMHVWKVNWYLGSPAPQSFIEQMRKEGRLQASVSGEEKDWLCPSHPANRKLEIESMVELARNYEVNGLHFDYIRYPGNDHCFCQRCRNTFETATGLKIADWRKDLQGPASEKWQKWRQDNITAVVKAVSEQARAVRPGIKISAAVFPELTTDRNSVAQDWKLWCENGYLDFVCPMDYSTSDRRFENLVKRQKEWASGVPYYPGIGLSTAGARFGAPLVIDQILLTRKHGTGGFTIFNYNTREASEVLPLLGLGITAPNAPRSTSK